MLQPATELGERARKFSASRPDTSVSSRRTGDKVLDRAIYVQNRLKTAIRRLYTWRAYLRLPSSDFNRTSAGLRWLQDVGEEGKATALMEWVLRPVDPTANKRFGAAFATSAAAQPIVDAGRVCRDAVAASGGCDPFGTCWTGWLKAVYDLFRRHRKELSARRAAWDAIVRETAVTLRTEQQKSRRFGALFRRAKPPSTAVSDESVWVQCPETPGRWILSSDPQTVKDFAAAHFRGLQSAHEWNRDPDEFPLYHAGPRKGQLRCTPRLQAVYAWDDSCET